MFRLFFVPWGFLCKFVSSYLVIMKSNILNSFKSCGLSAEEIYEASERISLLGRKVGPYSEAELKARGRDRIKMLHAAIMEKSCYTGS